MDGFTDSNEHDAAGDPPIDWLRVEEVAGAFATLEPLDALTALYGARLVVPA